MIEKVSSASPVRLQTSSRLKKSFERVKAQVDVDLLHFRRDLITLLGATSDVEGLSVLQRCCAASCMLKVGFESLYMNAALLLQWVKSLVISGFQCNFKRNHLVSRIKSDANTERDCGWGRMPDKVVDRVMHSLT